MPSLSYPGQMFLNMPVFLQYPLFLLALVPPPPAKLEAETTREEIHDYLEQNISEYKKTLVYASEVEALRKVYLGIKLFPDFQSLFPERLGLIGFDVTGWTKIAVPEISAIMIPAYQEGQIASRKLIEMIESKNSISNKKVIIKNAVRWRDSTL